VNEDKATRYHRLRRRAQAASLAASAAALFLVSGSGAARALADLAASIAGALLFWQNASPASSASSGGTATSAVASSSAAAAGAATSALASPAAAASFAPPALLTSIIVALFLLVLIGAITLPFTLYRDWVLDRRYGLERVSLRTWLSTYLKSAAVGVALAIVALVVMHVAAWISADWWWLIAALSLGGAQLGVTMAVPSVLPLFARLRPLTRTSLGARLEHLAKKSGGLALPVYEWRETTAARRAQAALVGLGRTRRVLLSDTLLEAFGEEEIEVIVAHELAHHVHHDLWTAALSRLTTLTAGFWLAHQWLEAMNAGRAGVRGPTDPAALPLIVMAVGAVTMIAAPLILALSRRQERQADRYSLDLTANPDAFVTVMRRMAAMNLAEDRPSRWSDFFFATHPPVNERIAAARAWRPRRSA
jgi:STE24 endopeptidase